METGGTIKAWERDEETSNNGFIITSNKFKEPKPTIGIIENAEIQHIENGNPISKTVITYKVWNEFSETIANGSLSYLKTIMSKAFMVTEKMRLSELDLTELDYRVPIYLEKHNSYFAIVSITRDSKGLCKCELIRLPG